MLIRATTVLIGAILGYVMVRFIARYRQNVRTISELRNIIDYLDAENEELRAALDKYEGRGLNVGPKENTGAQENTD